MGNDYKNKALGLSSYPTSKYNIDTDLGIEYQDAGPWRSYELTASGDTLEELLEDATISEVDQDGDELNCYGLDDCSGEIEKAALEIITDTIKKESTASE